VHLDRDDQAHAHPSAPRGSEYRGGAGPPASGAGAPSPGTQFCALLVLRLLSYLWVASGEQEATPLFAAAGAKTSACEGLGGRGRAGAGPLSGGAGMTAPVLLSVDAVSVRFGGIVALDGVSFQVAQGQICGLIGPNGAGKTTLFNCLSRLYRANSGRILFEGAPLFEVPRHRIAALGIGRTFQNLALFRSMSVLANVMTGTHCRTRGGFLTNTLALPLAAAEERKARARAEALVEELGLGAVAAT